MAKQSSKLADINNYRLIMKEHKKNGYIALITIVIISAIVLLITLSATHISLSQKLNIISQNQSNKSYYLAEACAHIAVTQLQIDDSYTGDEQIEVDGDYCTIEPITGSGNNNREIITSAAVGNYTRKIKVIIDQIRPSTETSYWGEFNE